MRCCCSGGKLELAMGSDMIGNFLAVESKTPLIAVAADFQKSPQALMSHPAVGMDKAGGPAQAKPVYPWRWRDQHILRLAQARVWLQGREHSAVQFQLCPLHREQEFNPAGLRHRRALRD